MEDPKERETHALKRLDQFDADRKAMKVSWDEWRRPPGRWRKPENLALLKADMANSGADGKQCKYLATPLSYAHSYDSVLEIYDTMKK